MLSCKNTRWGAVKCFLKCELNIVHKWDITSPWKDIYICIFVLWRSWQELSWLAMLLKPAPAPPADNVFLLLPKYSPCPSQLSRLGHAAPGLHMHLQSTQLQNQLDTPTYVYTVSAYVYFCKHIDSWKYNKACWVFPHDKKNMYLLVTRIHWPFFYSLVCWLAFKQDKNKNENNGDNFSQTGNYCT